MVTCLRSPHAMPWRSQPFECAGEFLTLLPERFLCFRRLGLAWSLERRMSLQVDTPPIRLFSLDPVAAKTTRRARGQTLGHDALQTQTCCSDRLAAGHLERFALAAYLDDLEPIPVPRGFVQPIVAHRRANGCGGAERSGKREKGGHSPYIAPHFPRRIVSRQPCPPVCTDNGTQPDRPGAA
jgi:hypothetical protein